MTTNDDIKARVERATELVRQNNYTSRELAEALTLLPALAADCERLQGENTKLTQELGAELLKQAKAVVADFHRENVLVQRAEERADKAQSATEALRADVTDWAHRHNEEAILRAQLAAKSMLLEADRDREKERADRAERARDELTALMVHAKDFARNAAPILNAHKQLVAAAQKSDEAEKNRIVAELGLIESPL